MVLFIAVLGFTQESWQRISPLPQERSLHGVTRIPGSGNIISVGEGSTYMISDDIAESWEVLHNPAGKNNDFYAYNVFFIDQQTGFICGGGNSVLKSTDGGYNWYQVYYGGGNYQARIRDIAFINDTCGFATTGGGILLQTHDRGETWTQKEAFGYALDEFVHYSDDTFVISTFRNYVYVSSDAGDNWTSVEIVPLKEYFMAMDMMKVSDSVLLISGALSDGITYNNQLILKSVDGGMTWEERFTDWRGGDRAEFFFFDALHGMEITSSIVGYGPAVFETYDGGNTWEEVWTPLHDNDYFGGGLLSDSSVIIVGKNGAIHISEDYGNSWQERYSASLSGSVFDCQFLSEEIGYCRTAPGGGGVASSAMKKTVDGGMTWDKIENGVCVYLGAFHFCSPDTGYIINFDYGLDNIARTFDGGETWDRFMSDIPDTETYAAVFLSGETGFVASLDGLIRVSDYGETVDFIPEMNAAFFDVMKGPDKNLYALGVDYSDNTILCYSDDNGETWDETFIDLPYEGKLAFASEDQIIICQEYQIFYSEDQGETWQQATVNSNDFMLYNEICFPSEAVGFVVGSGMNDNLLRTTDGGKIWNSIPTGVTSGLSSVHFWDDMNGIVLGENGIILRTDNGGTTFIEEKPAIPQQPSAITLFPNPATEILNITFEDPQQRGELIFYTTNGTEVMRRAHNPNVTGIIMNVDRLDAGAYVVQYVVDSKIIETTKIVIR
jgi:photosystem II stability/assembly factor-like uncharacterized protein